MFYRAKTAVLAALVTACVGTMMPSAAFARRRIRWRHEQLPFGRLQRWHGRLLRRL
jgi:hypothetical protein